jgi:hypothetical protein
MISPRSAVAIHPYVTRYKLNHKKIGTMALPQKHREEL